jgi:energy-coupling factor transporter transmembrane protein EcfT
MAGISVFSFRPGSGLLHRLDVRFKLAMFLLLSLAILEGAVLGLTILSLLVWIVLKRLQVSIYALVHELRFFGLLLLLVFCARAVFTPGPSLFQVFGIEITQNGLVDGCLVCWRLLLTVLTAVILISTTRFKEIKAAVLWLLKPIPLIPAHRIALMMGLSMRFIPVILNRARTISDTQRARCIQNRKNPFYRTIKFSVPLLRRTFQEADQLAAAMEARCFSNQRTEPRLKASWHEWAALAGTGGLGGLLTIL